MSLKSMSTMDSAELIDSETVVEVVLILKVWSQATAMLSIAFELNSVTVQMQLEKRMAMSSTELPLISMVMIEYS